MDIPIEGVNVAYGVNVNNDLGLIDSPTWEAVGLRRCEDITITGYWDVNEPDLVATISLNPQHLPRKAKRFLEKLRTGQPFGRRERERGVTLIANGQRIRIRPL